MTTTTIPKPQLRNLLQTRITKAIYGAVACSILGGLAWKYMVMEPRKKKYAEFYKTYDPVKRLKLMCDRGLLQACGPNTEN
ncbi:cytochrome c oxidase subunit 6C isoform X2 [Copidosoma floridanum]|nr:cytochrome c oxidase subunit 6C isoform X2 [Copidosoma floridanum]